MIYQEGGLWIDGYAASNLGDAVDVAQQTFDPITRIGSFDPPDFINRRIGDPAGFFTIVCMER